MVWKSFDELGTKTITGEGAQWGNHKEGINSMVPLNQRS